MPCMDFSGVTTALATPFREGALDRASFFRLLASQAAEGVRQFVINGTTGESPVLEEGEARTLFLWAREFERQSGCRLKLILGTGTFSTKASAEKTKKAAAMGADAALVVAPYYNRPPQRGLRAHFEAVAAAAPELPILLYNVPSRTAVSLEPETVEALSAAPNIIGIKEASGDMALFQGIRDGCGKDFLLLSGDDGTAADSFFLGGDGVISVASHVLGREFLNLFELSRRRPPGEGSSEGGGKDSRRSGSPPCGAKDGLTAGDGASRGKSAARAAPARAGSEASSALEEFKKKHEDFLRELYSESNPVGIKQVLHEAGLIASPELRLPLKAPEKMPAALKAAFRKLGKSLPKSP